MKRRLFFLPGTFIVFILSFVMVMTASAAPANTNTVHGASKCVQAGKTNTLQGTLDGAYYTIAVPANWNGTLLLYSHGYTFANQPLANPAPDASDALSAAVLLQQGDALAGSSYSQNGWAVQQAFQDQIDLLNYFDATCGHPARTIAWGDSLGGMITAGLVQLYPDRFSGALPMCGVLAGGIGTWNQALDNAFAFNVLLAGSTLSIVHISDPVDTLNQAQAIIAAAQKTPQGRARIALAASFSDLPGWFQTGSPAPASNDYTAQEQNQYLWDTEVDFAFAFGARAELEARAGGNPSWNVGVDYRHQLQLSVDRTEVQALYQQAGLSLAHDLATLNATPRIKADPQAVAYLNKYISYNGKVNIPVLTMHTTGDGLVVNEQEQAYAQAVQRRGDSNLLRQVFINRAGHCAFTPAEKLTALQTLQQRLNTGHWGNSTDPTLMNSEATALGSTLNQLPAAFIAFRPAPFLRPFDAWCRFGF